MVGFQLLRGLSAHPSMLSFTKMGHISFFNWSTGCESGVQLPAFYIFFLVFIIVFFF